MQEVWTWTDVAGVMKADPSDFADAEVIDQLTFDEVSEISYFGTKFLHPKTMRPLVKINIPLRGKILSTSHFRVPAFQTHSHKK